MTGILKGVLGSRRLLSISISLLLVGHLPAPGYGDEREAPRWGLSFLAGPNAGTADFSQLALLLQLGLPLHKMWDFELEGHGARYFIEREKNLSLLGVNGNILFRPIRWNQVIPYGLVGGGLAYRNNGRASEIGSSHLLGILQGGLGILYDAGGGFYLRTEYRFHHISDPFERDRGLNTHGLLLGITF